MVVDDDIEVRDALCDALRGYGFAVMAAQNGQEAIHLAEGRRPNLILLDLVMPLMNGYSFLEYRAHDPSLVSIPVIVVSATADQPIRDPGVAVLAKPVETQALLALIGQKLAVRVS